MNKQEAKKLEEKVLANVAKSAKYILALSGGADSVFLLHILQNHKLIAAHLNHKIRQESDKDQEFVEKLCQKLEVPLETHSVDIKKIKNKRGLEENGRIERYKFFNKLAKKHQAKYILTAHHADDNLETILMNFTRGGGLSALSGMEIQSENLLRPLLHISKNEILAYLKFHKIKFREDKTNKDTKFTRNFLRHEVIPRLKKINPNIESTIAKNSNNIKEIEDFINKKSLSWIKANASKNHSSLPLKKFQKLHPALQKNILRNLHKIISTSNKNLESTHIDEAITLAKRNIGNKKKKMGKINLYINSGRLYLEKIGKKVQY